MIRDWRKFTRLSGLERGLLVRATLILPLTALALRLLGFARTCSLFTRLAVRMPARSGARAEQVERMVTVAASRAPFPLSCLQRSLTIWWLLHREGIPSELRIGARKSGNRFAAHAWVACGDLVLDPAQQAGEYHAFAGSFVHAGEESR